MWIPSYFYDKVLFHVKKKKTIGTLTIHLWIQLNQLERFLSSLLPNVIITLSYSYIYNAAAFIRVEYYSFSLYIP